MIIISWKPVELQVALPRTLDASKLQDQMQQQGKLVQQMMAEQQTTVDEQKRKQVNDTQKKGDVLNNNKKESATGLIVGDHLGKDENASSTLHISHPYLGNHIDFNG